MTSMTARGATVSQSFKILLPSILQVTFSVLSWMVVYIQSLPFYDN